MEAVFEPVDLACSTGRLVSVLRSVIEKAGLRLTVACAPLTEAVYVDMWEKIVLNLLSNAFKFTFTGEIRVCLLERAGRVNLIVCDTGVDIPPEALSQVFEGFHRVAGTHGRAHKGSGIGLALGQELVKLHGGSVTCADKLGRDLLCEYCRVRGGQ